MKKTLIRVSLAVALIAPFVLATPALAAAPNWDVTGPHVWTVLGTYVHDLTLTMSPDGSFTGTGGYPSGSSPYTSAGQTTEAITNGQVSGDSITFTTTYAGLYNPGYTVTASGTIAPDGTISGTSPWSWVMTGSATPVVASCPEGTTQSQLKESVDVPANLVTGAQSSALSSGQTYLLVASGSWTNTPHNVADAEYTSLDNWTTVMDGYDISPYLLGEGAFDLQVDNGFVNWGSYNTAHSYSLLYTGTGNPASFRVFDGDSHTGTPEAGWYGDNVGGLTVSIYSCDVPPPPPVLGCTDNTAVNYNPAANQDDGSCVYEPSNKNACRKGGWETLVDADGHHFKNQGDCVSYVATKGKNKAAGN